MRNSRAIRSALLEWYARAARDLPWRRTRDPYRIWVSEIMLQQTRVAAVLPYYERFLERFPDVRALARAGESEVLALWSGLGYYSRARNLLVAARRIAAGGGFPRGYAELRALPGVGDYTAAAIASIAFDEPRAVLDGNVTRVLARLLDERGNVRTQPVRRRLEEAAGALLDAADPGRCNQALMELGATLCLPREPRCQECPLACHCAARRAGSAAQLPVKTRPRDTVRLERTLLLIRRGGRVLMLERGGFWELPEPAQVPGAVAGPPLAAFRHSVTFHRFVVTVLAARIRRPAKGLRWVAPEEIAHLPVSTAARKALAVSKPFATVTCL